MSQAIKIVKPERLNTILNGISQINSELGSDGIIQSSNIDQIAKSLNNSTSINSDLYIQNTISEDVKLLISNFFKFSDQTIVNEGNINIQTEKNGNFEIKISLNSFFSPLSKKIGESESPIVFLFFKTSFFDEESGLLDYICELISNRQMVFIFTDVKLKPEIINSFKSKNCWSLNLLSFEDLSKEIDSYFSADWLVNSLAISKTYSVARSLEGIFELLEMSIKKAGNNLKVKRAVSQQQTVKLGKPNSQGPSSLEILNELKSKIQNQIYSFEKGFSQRLDDFLRPQVGKLWKETAAIIDLLDGFEESKAHKTMELKVSEEFELSLFNEIKNKSHEYMINDLIAMRDQLQWIQTEIQEITSKNNIPFSSVNIRFLTDSSISKILNNDVRFDKSFKSEYSVKGWMEYLNAARKYQMIAAMMISTFGLSFVRNLKQYMIPLTVVLLGVGGYSVFVSVGKEREENMKKELEKARESIFAECRRIFMDLKRDWADVVSSHLKEQLQLVLNQMEPIIKDHFSNQSDLQGEEKKKIQRQLQASDMQERKLGMADKSRELLLKENQKFQTELRQAFLTVMNTKTVAK